MHLITIMSNISNYRTSKFSVLDLPENKDKICSQPVAATSAVPTSVVAETKVASSSQQSCDVESLILSALATDGMLIAKLNKRCVNFVFYCE